MSDIEDIRRLLADYCFGTDSGDTERWVACFTDDVVWDGGAFGRFEGKAAARAYHQGAGDAALNYRHINTNHVIAVDGDRAAVQSYVLLLDQSGSALAIAFSGFYDDALVRDGGCWRIRSRRLLPDARLLEQGMMRTADFRKA
ncbi:SnoaL-like domain-containing protein [Sphingobium faniae]|nr:SnoaL-like domain-containing protein [Sphingobium faniae]